MGLFPLFGAHRRKEEQDAVKVFVGTLNSLGGTFLGIFSISGRVPKEISFLIYLRQVPTTVSLIRLSLISKALILFITKL